MAVVVASSVLAASPDAVWERIGDFTAWHKWIPRIASIEMDPGQEAGQIGAVRNLTMSDGRLVRERLVHKDAFARTIAYDFPDGSDFPMRRYLGCVHVESITMTGGTYLRWSGDYDADSADEPRMGTTLIKIYESFIRNLADDLETA